MTTDPTKPSADDVLDRLEIDDRPSGEAGDPATTEAIVALVAGGALVLAAVRSALRGRRRAAVQALVGAALLALGFQLRGGPAEGAGSPIDLESESTDEADDSDAETGKDVSDGAHAAVEDAGGGRGTESDTSPATDPGSGVSFTDDQDDEPRSKPDLDGGAADPRRNDADEGEDVELNVSDAALADEASEATGPSPEQAQPTRTEGTEPESGASEDASHTEADAPDEDDETDEDESDDDGPNW